MRMNLNLVRSSEHLISLKFLAKIPAKKLFWHKEFFWYFNENTGPYFCVIQKSNKTIIILNCYLSFYSISRNKKWYFIRAASYLRSNFFFSKSWILWRENLLVNTWRHRNFVLQFYKLNKKKSADFLEGEIFIVHSFFIMYF